MFENELNLPKSLSSLLDQNIDLELYAIIGNDEKLIAIFLAIKTNKKITKLKLLYNFSLLQN